MLRLLSASAVLALPLLSGCHASFHEARFNNGTGAAGERTLVVPFRESRRALWYRESPNGVGLVRFMREWTDRDGVDAVFAESEYEEEILHRVGNWPKDRITVDEWVQIARPAGVRYVVEGDIVSLQLSHRLAVNYFDPEAIVSYRVIDVVKGREVTVRKNWKVRFTEKESQFQISLKFDDPQKVRTLFLAYLGKRLGQDLYGYYEE